jgi:hypothetical protein
VARPSWLLLPPVEPAAFEALKADIAVHGVLVPIAITLDLVIVDGYARARAARELGLECPWSHPQGVDTHLERTLYAVRANLHRASLDDAAFRDLVGTLLAGRMNPRSISTATGLPELWIQAYATERAGWRFSRPPAYGEVLHEGVR